MPGVTNTVALYRPRAPIIASARLVMLSTGIDAEYCSHDPTLGKLSRVTALIG